jgi:predicted glycogen debranching enzyme
MDYDEEWLISNRNGSYASSSVSFSNLRTYHGIYVKNTSSGYDRYVLLSKLFEEIELEGRDISLDTNYYRDAVYPQGYRLLSGFEPDPVPTFYYDIHGTKVVKKLVMDPENDVIMINYKFTGVTPKQFRLYPLTAFRNYHNVARQSGKKVISEEEDHAYKFSCDDIHFRISKNGNYIEDNLWYYNFRYPLDEARGSNYMEDLYLPGHFEIDKASDNVTVSIYSDEQQNLSFADVEKRYVASMSSTRVRTGKMRDTVRESTKFLVRENIIAGYYWFGPWARDTLISLAGILLVPKRYNEARGILLNYAKMIRDGLVPKTITDPDNYDTADSSLWFIYGAYKYYQYTKDLELVRLIYPRLLEILETYRGGTDLFRMEGNLINLKKPQLTWMDARTGDTIFTPRMGKPVEVNALWYNALESVKFMSHELGLVFPEHLETITPEVKKTFHEKFVRGDHILDVADPDDYSIRPNALFAFSLPYPVLDNFSAYNKDFDQLLTPYGLRSLTKEDRRYIGKYEGDQYHRDSAYHNGSIWPWLTGPYITASVRGGADRKKLLSYFMKLYSLRQIPEIFDGDEPHNPGGCIIQAWSYAELIRAYFEDLKR